ncbi:phenylacetate--CoA ligase family protein [Thermodesulfobacteriota bacterium]
MNINRILNKGCFEALSLLTGKLPVERKAFQNFQGRQLHRLVKHAYESVPYYRMLFEKNGFHPDHLDGLKSISRVPISSKADMLSYKPTDLISSETQIDKLLSRRTTGSTGIPFTVHYTSFEQTYLSALRLKSLKRLGFRTTDKRARIRIYDKEFYGSQSLITRIAGSLPIYRTIPISISSELCEIVKLLTNLEPDIIQGYSNVIYRLSVEAEEMGRILRPRMVIVGADCLTEGMRRQIESTFQCPVREMYGSTEFNMIAWECSQSGQLHVCEEGVILEVLRDGKPVSPGEWGEVVITALHSFAQPFIRFRLGDFVTWGEESCSCGAPYSTILAIDGRMMDRILLPDGQTARPYKLFFYLAQEQPWIRQHQMVQESNYSVILKLVPSRQPEPDELKAVDREMLKLLGQKVSYRVELMPEITLKHGEKFRVSRSYVYSHFSDHVQS